MSLDILIREEDGFRRAGALVIGRGVPLATTAGGLPELLQATSPGETQLMPSGGDDTQAIRDALALSGRVRLGPGDFAISANIALGSGQSLVGCGPARTRIIATNSPDYLQAILRVTGSGAAVEGLFVLGFGLYTGISVESAADVRLRDLRINGTQYGVRLTDVIRGEVSRVFAEEVTAVGIQATGGERLSISDVSTLSSNAGLVLTQVEGARCTGLTLRDHLAAVTAGGDGLSFSSVFLDACNGGMSITGARGVSVSGLHARDCGSAVRVTNSSAIALDGCSALRTGTAVSIAGSTAVTVDGLVSDRTGSGHSGPHVVVGSGSTLVTLTGVHRVNPATPPQYEVDVSGAGGRVVFIQHDFDPARVNSGGNFAEL